MITGSERVSATGKSIQLRCQSIFCLKITAGGCVYVCVCVHWVEQGAGKDRHLKGQSLGSYTSYTQWRSRVCVCVCAEGRKGQASERAGLELTHFTHRVEIQSGT